MAKYNIICNSITFAHEICCGEKLLMKLLEGFEVRNIFRFVLAGSSWINVPNYLKKVDRNEKLHLETPKLYKNAHKKILMCFWVFERFA